MQLRWIFGALILIGTSTGACNCGTTPPGAGTHTDGSAGGRGDGSAGGGGGGDGSMGGGGGGDGSMGGGGGGDGSMGGGGGGDGATGSGSDGGPTCPLYQMYCNGMCIPTSVDPNNCGGCNNHCTGNLNCSGGKCEANCLPGTMPCNNSCVDFNNDNDNCGRCGHACPQGQGCAAGGCVPAANVGNRMGQCTGGGPPIIVNMPGQNQGTCAGNLAQTTFTWALCSCSGVHVSSEFMTDGFDSTRGPYMPGGLGGGVGLNGAYDSSSSVDVGGTLWCSSNSGVTTSAQTTVHQEMHSGGILSGQMSIGTDAYVKGDVTGGPITIGGTLYHPGGMMGVSGVTAHAIVDRAVTVPTPCVLCPMEQPGLLPIAPIVAARRTDNDNATIGLRADLFANGGGPQRLDLPCGNFYLDAISNSSELTIYAHGNTALYVGADISASAALALTLSPTAQFDIFVGGTINTSSGLLIGSPSYPALTRTYVAGSRALDFSSEVSLSGNLYDGAALVSWSADVAAYGAIYAGDFNASSRVNIHYDRAVVNAGATCPPPDAGMQAGGMDAGNNTGSDSGMTGSDGGTAGSDSGTAGSDGGAGGNPDAVPTTGGCTSCRDCNNQACNNGVCGACTTNADCCAPLACVLGVCQFAI